MDFLRDLLDKCLTLDPARRLTAQEAVNMFAAASGGGK
jgi:serine/threonine protein kinase